MYARVTNVPQARMIQTYGNLPLHFEANRGQTAEEVKFLARGSNHTLFLTPAEAVLVLTKADPQGRSRRHAPKISRAERGKATRSVLRTSFVGANRKPRIDGHEELVGKTNYFIGSDPANWRTGVPTYARVRYHELYPGIDLVYYGNQRQLEYDFVVAEEVDPQVITLAVEGASRLEVDVRGDLVIHTPAGALRQQKPVIYQEIDGIRRAVAGGYVLKGRHRVGFQVAAYDHSQPLVIDPILLYSTYLGGSDGDFARDVAVDGAGNAYVTGVTSSVDFPTMAAAAFQSTYGGGTFDAFVTKFNASGSALIYSTYLGGNDSDVGIGIDVDTLGNAYVTGHTISRNFPTTLGAFQTTFRGIVDAFVTKLDLTGSALVYSSYLGGTRIENGLGIAVDPLGNAHVTGLTESSNFPTTVGAFQTTFGGGGGDAFVTKVDPTGSTLVYSTYLGRSDFDDGLGIALDSPHGYAYVTGVTGSHFPTTPGAFQTTYGGGFEDAFVTKLNLTGSALVYSTYLGGANFDEGSGIDVDFSGTPFVTGATASGNFPTTPGAIQTTYGGGFDDAFVTKLDATGSSLIYSTYLGGSDFDNGVRIAMDAGGNAHVTGSTKSSDFPTTMGALQSTYGGGFADAFVTELNITSPTLAYSTYLGGSDNDDGFGIALDASGNTYVSGRTSSANFPTTPGAFQTTYGGGGDAFVAKIGAATIPGLIDEVRNLPLNRGQQNSLIVKLEAAQRALARGNRNAAIDELNAFINEVQALQSSGQLDMGTADRLIGEAQDIINGL